MAEQPNPKADAGQRNRVETVAPSSVSDQPTADDSLGFKPYVEAIAAFLTHRDTKPPAYDLD
jgi:hypothetical protein